MPESEKPVVHIRVLGKATVVEDIATQVGEYLVSQGYELIEQTLPSTVREDPSQARVFVTVR